MPGLEFALKIYSLLFKFEGGGGMSFPKRCSDEEGMDEQAFPTVFFWLFSKVWHQT